MSMSSHLILPQPQKAAIAMSMKKKKHDDDSISLVQICKSPKELLQVQTLLVKTSLIHQKHSFGRLLLSFTSMDYDSLVHARKLFDTITFPPNSFVYNTMIKAYSKHGCPREAFLIYMRMVCDGCVCPDDFTFTFVFSACLRFNACFEGKQAHAQMIKSPFDFGTHSWNSLMSFYNGSCEFGSVVIRRVFDRVSEPDVVSWNCLLHGYVNSGELSESMKVFDEMPQRDIVSWTTMLVGYVNAGLMDEASLLFSEMPKTNMISWSALISGYIKTGCYGKALEIFKKMQDAEVEMDKVTMTVLLSACANLGALDQGRWIHAYTKYNGIEVDDQLSTALIDMYCKCGRIDIAMKIFRKFDRNKKVYMWNAMLGGLAIHSLGEQAITLFSKMIECKVEPNEITFLCVLAACNHSGLVNEGLRIFQSMVTYHNIKPTIEHYGCVVDLLGRSGLFKDAIEIIRKMPMNPDANLWRALLSGCKLHCNADLGEQVGRILIEMESLNETNYVLLSNIYASSNRWEEVRKLRKEMKAKGLVKTPGCSSIELNGSIHDFVVGDYRHIKSREIYDELNKMAHHMVLQDELNQMANLTHI